MAADPDYDAAIMQLAHDTLSKDTKIDYEIVARLEQVMAKVSPVLGFIGFKVFKTEAP